MLRLADDFGLRGAALGWVVSYLAEHSCFVKVSKQVSGTLHSETGVPQGSVLDPLLFSANVSPIARLIDSFGVKHISYADDITLYVSLDGNAATIISQLNDCATSVSR